MDARVMTCLAVLFVCINTAYTETGPVRVWTSATGKKLEARLISDQDGVVTLAKSSGGTIRIRRSSLSAVDQAYLDGRSHAARRPQTTSRPNKPEPTRQTRSTRFTAAQMVANLDDIGPLKASTPVKGQPRMMASGRNGTLMLEVIGPPNDLKMANLLVGIPADRKDIAYANAAYLMLFMKNGFPEWDGAGDWILKAVEEVSETEKAQSVRHGNKRLALSILPALGAFTATVEIVD